MGKVPYPYQLLAVLSLGSSLGVRRPLPHRTTPSAIAATPGVKGLPFGDPGDSSPFSATGGRVGRALPVLLSYNLLQVSSKLSVSSNAFLSLPFLTSAGFLSSCLTLLGSESLRLALSLDSCRHRKAFLRLSVESCLTGFFSSFTMGFLSSLVKRDLLRLSTESCLLMILRGHSAVSESVVFDMSSLG